MMANARETRPRSTTARLAGTMIGVLSLLAACAPEGPQRPSSSPSAPEIGYAAVEPTGTATVITTGLMLPWSIVRLESGSTLVSERDTATIKELLADGSQRELAVVPGVAPAGEGGLLGLEVVGADLYAYISSDDDNRIVRFDLEGAPGSYTLGEGTPILTGIERETYHNGGRVKLGPDGMLYATVGDAGARDLAQDPDSLNGKILRMNLDGTVPDDNPTPGSLVYSMGHRNPQGITWDDDGQLWAAEFGQDTWDEVNRIEPGANYGWPVIEGIGDDPAYVNPIAQWPTDDSSPSGLTFIDGTLFMAGLGGERLWAIYPASDSAVTVEWFSNTYGRIRDVVPGPDGTLWMLTNNTGNRGELREGDDRILEVELTAVG